MGVRVGLAGAGVFGRFHGLKLKADSNADLRGVFDIDQTRADALGAELGCRGFSDLDTLLEQVDAMVVAVPALFHADVAARALKAGRHCLVEKPLAAAADDADELVALADAAGLVLQAGHQERYVFKAMGLLDVDQVPLSVEAVRAGPPSPRGADVSVTLDLMVHDLDLAGLLFRARPDAIAATRLAGPAERPDAIDARLTYPAGAKARFTASRVADARERWMRVVYPSGELHVDFVAKTFTDGAGLGLHADFATRIADPMAAAMGDFLAAVRGERPVAIPGRDGAAAARLANAVDAAASAA